MQQQVTQKKEKAKRKSNQHTVKEHAPVQLHEHSYLQKQGIIGNHGILGHYGSNIIQAKLIVGSPDDRYEKEADRVAEQVMRMTNNGHSWISKEPSKIQRKCAACTSGQGLCPKCAEEEVQRKTIFKTISPFIQRQAGKAEEEEEEISAKERLGQTPTVSTEVTQNIKAFRGGGQPLPSSERAFFETSFGFDFSKVRIHADQKAAETAQSVNARAFTVGRNVVFGAGQYSTETDVGRRLLAHELTHVVQQNEGRAYATSIQDIRLSEPSDSYEQVADHVADRVNQGQSAVAISAVPWIAQKTLQRKKNKAQSKRRRARRTGEYVTIPDPKGRPAEWIALSGYSEIPGGLLHTAGSGGVILDVWFDGSDEFFYVRGLKYCLPSNWIRSTTKKKAKYCGTRCPDKEREYCKNSFFNLKRARSIAPTALTKKDCLDSWQKYIEQLPGELNVLAGCLQCLHNACKNTNFDLTDNAKYACLFRLHKVCEEWAELNKSEQQEKAKQQKKPKRKKKRKRRLRDWKVRR